MKLKILMMTAASAALVVSGPLAAQKSSNGKQTREQARQSSQGPKNANQRGVQRSNENSVLKGSGNGQADKGKRDKDMKMRDDARQNSRPNASDRARDRANQNSAVRSGMMVHDKSGKMIGKVRDVKRAPDGTIIAIIVVLVVQVNGSNVITLPAGSFTIINNVIVVNQINLSTGS